MGVMAVLDLGVSGGWNDLIKGPVGSKHEGKVPRAVLAGSLSLDWGLVATLLLLTAPPGADTFPTSQSRA